MTQTIKNKGNHQAAKFSGRFSLIALAVIGGQFAVTNVQAQSFNISPQSLTGALNDYADTANVQLSYPAHETTGIQSAGLNGNYTPQQALQKLLDGTGLKTETTANGTITLTQQGGLMTVADTSSAPSTDSGQTLPKVTVEADTEQEIDPYDPVDTAEPYNKSYTATNVITATKMDTPIMETPTSVQVLTHSVLQDQQAIGLETALKNVSGVQQLTGGGQYDAFLLRGFPTTEHFRNGIRLPEHAIDTANVERIEVLKGPSAMLYGRIDPGGMINVVTKKPLDKPYYSLQQQFGSYDLFRTTLDATGPLTSNRELAYRMNFSYLDSGSFRDAVNRDRVFLAPSLSWNPSNDTEFNLSFEYRDENVPFEAGLPSLNGRVIDIPISRNLNQPLQQDHIESKLVDFNWSHRFNDKWKIQNGVTAQLADYQFRDLPTAGFQPRFSAADPFLRRGLYFEDFSRDMHNVYLNLTGEFDTWGAKHKVLLGGDYYNKETNTSGFAAFNGTDEQRARFFSFVNVFDPATLRPSVDINAADQLRKTAPNDFGFFEESWYGLYFQDQITLWDKLYILGGGRYDWARAKNASNSSPIQKSDIGIQNVDIFSPRVGIVYQPVNWLSVYGNFIESYGLNNRPSQDGRPLAPETATNFEAGFKTEWFDGKLSTNFVYYHLTKNNVLSQLAIDFPAFNTIGEARSQGIEFDISGQVTDELSLIASYAYTDARITEDTGSIFNNDGNLSGTNSGNTGNRLPNAPEHAASFWAKYAFQQSALRGLSLGTGVYLASSRQADTGNTVTLPGYVRWDAYAAYTFNVGQTKLTTQLNVNNILDKRYFYNGDAQNFGASINNNIPGEPLSFMGLVKLEY